MLCVRFKSYDVIGSFAAPLLSLSSHLLFHTVTAMRPGHTFNGLF